MKGQYAIRRFKGGMWLDLNEIRRRDDAGTLSERDRATLAKFLTLKRTGLGDIPPGATFKQPGRVQ